jgi:hypothetical protein
MQHSPLRSMHVSCFRRAGSGQEERLHMLHYSEGSTWCHAGRAGAVLAAAGALPVHPLLPHAVFIPPLPAG